MEGVSIATVGCFLHCAVMASCPLYFLQLSCSLFEHLDIYHLVEQHHYPYCTVFEDGMN